MAKIMIEEEELNLLVILYDRVKGFGREHAICPMMFMECERIDLLTQVRQLSFLSEYDLAKMDYETQTKKKEQLAAEIEHNYKQIGVGPWRGQVYRDEIDRIKAVLKYTPDFMVYVTGHGANYVRRLRADVELKLKPKKNKSGEEVECGLKEIPKTGDYIRQALRLSKSVVIGTASNILASIITGK